MKRDLDLIRRIIIRLAESEEEDIAIVAVHGTVAIAQAVPAIVKSITP